MNETLVTLKGIYQRLNLTPEAIAQFCEKWQIIELSLFASVLHDDLVSKRGIQNSRNPSRRNSTLESTQVIYAERSEELP